jgi:sucrose-6-phosphate hydrolase SacC (GH32 family)
MTIPRELQLLKTTEGYSLAQTPVRELIREFKKRYVFENVQTVPLDNQAAYLILRMPNRSTVLEFSAGDKKLELIVDMDARTITLDRRGCGYAEMGESFYRTFSAPLLMEDSCVSIQILLDKNSLELFTDRGKTVCTMQYFIESHFTELRSSEMLHSVEVGSREEKSES